MVEWAWEWEQVVEIGVSRMELGSVTTLALYSHKSDMS